VKKEINCGSVKCDVKERNTTNGVVILKCGSVKCDRHHTAILHIVSSYAKVN
jgi:hypothetical protein